VREKRREAERWNGTEKRSREHPGGLYFAGARRWRQGQAARAATRYLRRWPEVEDGPDSRVPPASESEGEGRGGGRRFRLGCGDGPAQREREGEEKRWRWATAAAMSRGEGMAHFSFSFSQISYTMFECILNLNLNMNACEVYHHMFNKQANTQAHNSTPIILFLC
jgi:hypothetical protein